MATAMKIFCRCEPPGGGPYTDYKVVLVRPPPQMASSAR
jgi:hypothetical protein